MASSTLFESVALRDRYRRVYSAEPRIFRAPGRVNIIGEHTDYNDGFVMPAAIALYTRVAVHHRAMGCITAQSENLGQRAFIDFDEPNPAPRHDWSDYVRGVALAIRSSGRSLEGANLLIQGNVPIGSGLSSSASLEVATALALLGVSGLELSRTEIARLCQSAENNFVGAKTGIMDQFTSCHGREGHALFLDCRSLEYHYIPIPRNAGLLVCNTMVRHSLASGEYNLRRQQCSEGVRLLSTVLPEISSLRDVSRSALDEHRELLDETIYRRCLHVVNENNRVTKAGIALLDGALKAAGELMNASHESLRGDYEVSCPELDLMVNLARDCPGVFGARMTGGGFGGCIVCLIDKAKANQIARAVTDGYKAHTGIVCETYFCPTADGADEELI